MEGFFNAEIMAQFSGDDAGREDVAELALYFRSVARVARQRVVREPRE